jgi:hypothetical protein
VGCINSILLQINLIRPREEGVLREHAAARASGRCHRSVSGESVCKWAGDSDASFVFIAGPRGGVEAVRAGWGDEWTEEAARGCTVRQ